MFQVEHGVVVANRRLEHTFRIIGSGGNDDLDARRMEEPGFGAGGMEWAALCAAPDGPRITIGTGMPTRQYIFEAILMIWSKPQVIKSINCISAIGRMPIKAAPTAEPIIAASAIGVSMTRSGPNSSNRPALTLKAPP